MSTPNEKYYISMLSDFGFKRAFGNTNDTLFLRTALKALLCFERDIVKVKLGSQERAGTTKESRAGIVDVTCTDELGHIYIVEMQRINVEYFIHRLKFYTFQRYDTLVKRGKYKFQNVEKTKIYTVSFLEETAYPNEDVHQVVQLRNEKGRLIDDQIMHVFIQLEKFNKPFEALKTDLDKLLYVMKYTETITKEEQKKKKIPVDKWIDKMLKELEMSNLSPEERADAEIAIAREAFALQWQKQKDKDFKKQARLLKRKEQLLISKEEQLISKEEQLKDKDVLMRQKTENTVKELLALKTISDAQIMKIADIDKATLEEIRKKE